MATRIVMKHKETGILKNGYYGFSWTTLLFGFFPALFRADFLTFIGSFVILVIIGLCTYGIGLLLVSLIWAFMYNKYYCRKLLEKGYVLAGAPNENILAASALGIIPPDPRSPR
ncbi:hypothetical protein N5W20_02505 [Candidatus Kirkpatrickella diaphorinae]|uniref:HrgC protein n=1 Tax=Candidatus Kirkpatrickella diaphorinae TaxID=2984322 RepID=A0ABY6GKA8_9PROT|nr:hypothetical protein [Candidatus Kirkpatrickella diaphorinae]UYH51759.1 hypothetical protein N5W20_02505 [Candidatus Kirkpatrickella diaphorinae]